jgi:hypothetical protein
VKADRLYRRLEALETKAKPRVISSWVDLVIWLDEHEDDEGDVEVELCPELQELFETTRSTQSGRAVSEEVGA